MNIGKNKILLISYVFPPSKGIGGRRWAKFVKNLFRNGHDVKVVTFSNGIGSLWSKDVLEYKDSIQKIQPNQPFYMTNDTPSNILGKIRYKISRIIYKMKYSGNIYDFSIGFKKQLYIVFDDHLEKGYNNIIVSAAPFYMAYYAAQYKKKNPAINLILDFRDPWTTNKMGYWFKDMPPKRQKVEKGIEKYTVTNADVVYTVNETMTDYFTSIASSKVKVKTIRNGYDTDDFNDMLPVKRVDKGKLKFVYAGMLYENVDYIFNPLIEVLKKMPSTEAEKFEFNFYGGSEEHYQKNVLDSKLNNVIKFQGIIPLSDVFNEIQRSDCAMLFLTKDLKDSFSTKFYEYISQRKFVAVFSDKGETSKFVERNGLGISITPDNIGESLKELLILKKRAKLNTNKSFSIEKYSVKALVEEIEIDLK